MCFSVVDILPNRFGLLTFIATARDRRSKGVGSAHMLRLIKILKESYPDHVGLFLEIESVRPDFLAGLDADSQSERRRRLAFYERVGARRYDGEYRILSFLPGVEPIPAELLWFEYGDKPLDREDVKQVIRDIYEKIYERVPQDPAIERVLSG